MYPLFRGYKAESIVWRHYVMAAETLPAIVDTRSFNPHPALRALEFGHFDDRVFEEEVFKGG
jgi:hypothetical protein